MARDRKRARQRRARQTQPGRAAAKPPSPQGDPQADTPGPLEHSSAEVDIAEQAMVDPPEADLGADELVHEDELEPVAGGDGGDDDGGRAVATAPGGAGQPAPADAPRERGRFRKFLRACWAELQRVQWPDRRQVGQATAVVLGFVLIAGTYLGLLDAVFQRFVDAIL